MLNFLRRAFAQRSVVIEKPDQRVGIQEDAHSLSASHSTSRGSSRSPRIVTDPFIAPRIDFGLSINGTISATGLPFLVTTIRSCLEATSSSTPKNFALHSDAFMVFVITEPII